MDVTPSPAAEDWVALGLLLQRGVTADGEGVARAMPWIEATLEVLALLPPVGVIADLGRLLTRGPFDIAASEVVPDPDLRAALDAYEEHLLGRLSADFRLELARDALLRLAPELRPAAVAVFVEQILARVAVADLDSPGPAAVRRVLHRQGGELIELGASLLTDPEAAPLRAVMTERYTALAAGARRRAALIGDVELFTLENHRALRSASQRLAMAQIAEAAQAIERTLPVRVRRSDASRGRTPTRVEDESAYPIGGYSSISTIGGIESLVSSELIYMSSPQARAAGDIDLFDVRWAAGELLKYTRDESVHTRERRTLTFVFLPSLERARVKDPEVHWQRIVIASAGYVAGVRKLCAWLDEAELHVDLASVAAAPEPGRDATQPLATETALARLVLREYVESGVVRVVEIDDREAARKMAEDAAEIGGSDLIWVGGDAWNPPTRRAEPVRGRRAQVREHAITCDRATPTLWIDAGRGPEARPVPADRWEGWTWAFRELLRGLV